MAHRLTEQEHDTVLTLAKTLGRQLPSQFRSVAGGIASGLVRSRKSPLPAADGDSPGWTPSASRRSIDCCQRTGAHTFCFSSGFTASASRT